MDRDHLFLIFCLAVLLSLASAPVLAATVTCPSSCSCLLPDEAKKIGSPGYCKGVQKVCDHDSQKNEKYCYEKPVTMAAPQLIVTGYHLVTTTTATIPSLATCPDTCTCIPDEKAQGAATPLALCGKTKTYCGSTAAGVKEYCYQLPTDVTASPTVTTVPCPPACTCTVMDKGEKAGLGYCGTKNPCGITASGEKEFCFMLPAAVTTTPVTAGPADSCSPGCRCLAPDKADPSGYKRCNSSAPACSYDPLGRAMYCYAVPHVTMVSPVPADGTLPDITSRPPSDNAPADVSLRPSDGPVPQVSQRTTMAGDSGIFAAVTRLFASIFGGGIVNGGSRPDPGALSNIEAQRDLTFECSGPGHGTCDGDCVNLSSNLTHCGSCGNGCFSSVYCKKRCSRTVVIGGATICHNLCSRTKDCCNGACIEIMGDELNCGGCAIRCGPGENCCYGHCSNLSSDWMNCGSCGETCPYTKGCCNGNCMDIRNESGNCGSCDTACPLNQQCRDGTCIPRISSI